MAKKITAKKTKPAAEQQTEEVAIEPINQPVLASAFDYQRGFIRLISGLTINADIAYRTDRQLQRQMRRDPLVMAPLMQRQYATALAEWDIVPQDFEDETQRSQSEELKHLIQRNMPKWTEFVRSLLEAVWYGRSATNIIYGRTRDGIAPIGWKPFHPDSLTFNEFGGVGVYVSHEFEKNNPGKTTTIGHVGKVRMFDDVERRAVVVHSFHVEAPDYEEPEETQYLFGRGLRDRVFFYWRIKQTILQLWTNYCERYAMGTRIGKYPEGNHNARVDMEKAMRNLIADVNLLMPGGDGFEFEIHEPNASAASVFDTIIRDRLAGDIRNIIIGKGAATEEVSGGIGSDTSTRQTEGTLRIVMNDAKSLGDTLTREFIHVLHEMNFGDTPYRPRIEFAVEDVDSEKWMAGVKSFVDLGGKAPMDQVRRNLGIREPIEGEEVLEREEFDPMTGEPAGAGASARAQYRKTLNDNNSDGSSVDMFYDPNQPRVPAGYEDGGQWTDSKGVLASSPAAKGMKQRPRLDDNALKRVIGKAKNPWQSPPEEVMPRDDWPIRVKVADELIGGRGWLSNTAAHGSSVYIQSPSGAIIRVSNHQSIGYQGQQADIYMNPSEDGIVVKDSYGNEKVVKTDIEAVSAIDDLLKTVSANAIRRNPHF